MKNTERGFVRVTAAVIRDGIKVLLAQRRMGDPLAGKWEFPGGKIETGETPEECLRRELKEELKIAARVGGFIAASRWEYSHVYVELLAYETDILSGTPEASDHEALAWADISALLSWDLAPADVAIAQRLKRKR